MAASPAHKFGQIIGHLMEDIMLPVLQDFCTPRGLYLDKKGTRPGVRNGRKLTWSDKYGNSHDLDFVVEKDGSKEQAGRPVAFIEVAWRRYAKHSKNKAQEIQAAVLPIVERHIWDRPFVGVILAGIFTSQSLEQLRSFGFSVLHFDYEKIVAAFRQVAIDVDFDESTPDLDFSRCIKSMESLSKKKYTILKTSLLNANKDSVNFFMAELAQSLERQIERLVIVPLYGKEHVFRTCAEAIAFVNSADQERNCGEFQKYEIFVNFSNGDKMEASFKDNVEAERFLKYVAS